MAVGRHDKPKQLAGYVGGLAFGRDGPLGVTGVSRA